MTRPQVRRRPARQQVTVVVGATIAYVEAVDPDELQVLLLDVGVEHVWDGVRWTVPVDAALSLGAALRAAGMVVRLASGSPL